MDITDAPNKTWNPKALQRALCRIKHGGRVTLRVAGAARYEECRALVAQLPAEIQTLITLVKE